MIQRIQTIYLLFATILMGVMFKLPLATLVGKMSGAKLYAVGVISNDNELIFSSTWFMGLVLTATLLPLITVFLFKKRRLQMRLCMVELVLLAMVLGGIAYQIYFGINAVITTGATYTIFPTYGDVIPLVAAVFVWLAWRGIRADERLVRSLDRIR